MQIFPSAWVSDIHEFARYFPSTPCHPLAWRLFHRVIVGIGNRESIMYHLYHPRYAQEVWGCICQHLWRASRPPSFTPVLSWNAEISNSCILLCQMMRIRHVAAPSGQKDIPTWNFPKEDPFSAISFFACTASPKSCLWEDRRGTETPGSLKLNAAQLNLRTGTSWKALFWEEPSLDQYQSRGKLLTNFQGHWSVLICPETRHQGIGPYGFPLKFIWTNGSQISLKVLVYIGIVPQSALPPLVHMILSAKSKQFVAVIVGWKISGRPGSGMHMSLPLTDDLWGAGMLHVLACGASTLLPSLPLPYCWSMGLQARPVAQWRRSLPRGACAHIVASWLAIQTPC